MAISNCYRLVPLLLFVLRVLVISEVAPWVVRFSRRLVEGCEIELEEPVLSMLNIERRIVATLSGSAWLSA